MQSIFHLRFFLVFAIAVLILFKPGFSENPILEEVDVSQRFKLEGYVFDVEGEPLTGAQVYLHETLNGSITDQNGFYSISNIKPGSYHLHIKFLGFEAHAKTIEIKNRDVQYSFSMRNTDLEISEVIIESNLLKRKAREKSLSIEVISAEQIREKGGNTLIHSLEHIPGVNAMSTGTNIVKPVIRGLGFNRVLLNENGIKQEGQQWGEEHGLEIDQFAVERVEVIKGPGSLLYGSDALGGVINISPQRYPSGDFIKGGVDFNARSNNELIGLSAYSHFQKNRKFIYFRASALDYGDFKVPADSFTYNRYILPIENERLKNTAGREYALTGRIGIQGDRGSSNLQISNIDQTIGFFPGAIGIPRAYLLEDDGDSRNIDIPNQEISHFKVISNNTLLFRKNWLDIDLGFQQNVRNEISFPHSHGFGPRPEDSLALGLNLKTFTANMRYYSRLNESINFITGINSQYQINEISGFEFLIPEYRSIQAGIFHFAEWDVSESLIVNGGIRFDYGYFDIDEYLEPLYSEPEVINGFYERVPDTERNFYNFSAGLGLSYMPNENWNFKFNSGRSFKMPNIAELGANGVHHSTFRHEQGNPDLDVETGYQFDVSMTYRTSNFRIALSPFFNYFDNHIYLQPSGTFSFLPHTGQLYNYVQANAVHFGGEWLLEYHPVSFLHLEWNTEYVMGHNIEENYPLPFIPPLTNRFIVEYRHNKDYGPLNNIHLNFQARHTAKQSRIQRNEKATDGYLLFNAGIGTSIDVKNQSFYLQFRVDNILDTRYKNHLSYYRLLNLPEAGRNFTLSISIPLHKDL
ncbi:MAG: TonB-dependent receptor [Chitinophagaceae bacterium]|nr:MAG: TonB-dependent receptor [Chitinophagaceae bacterium]